MRVKKIVSGLILIALCLGVLLVLQLWSNNGTSPTTLYESRESSNQVVDASTSDFDVVAKPDLVSVFSSPLFLDQECPELLDDSVWTNKECLAAIEEHFLDRGAYTLEYVGMIPKDAPFTFRSMFTNYENDRELVHEALSRPECRLLAGPIRQDLREACNADALFRYVHFSNLCHDAQERRNYFTTWKSGSSEYKYTLSELEHMYINDVSDQTVYFSERNRMRKAVLRDVWIISEEKCPSDVSVSFLYPPEGRPASDDLAAYWNAGASDEQRNPPQSDIAARLGFEWLLIGNLGDFQFTRHLFWSFDHEFEQSKRQLYPWMVKLREALYTSSYDRSDAVLKAVQGLVSLTNSGFEPDVVEYVKQLCEVSQKHIATRIEDCATAITDVKSFLDASDMQELRMLDRIENEALALGLYQY